MRIFLRLLLLLWPEIVLAVIYLQNRTLIKSKRWKTLYELAFGKPPNINYLKVYGCRAYALRYGIPKTNKLEPRAKLSHLIDYKSTNIYKIWIPATNKVIRTKNVIFDKNKFFLVKKNLLLKFVKQVKKLHEFIYFPENKPTPYIEPTPNDLKVIYDLITIVPRLLPKPVILKPVKITNKSSPNTQFLIP